LQKQKGEGGIYLISTTAEEKQMLDNMMDNFEESLKGRGFLFSTRHRLRWWAVRAFKFWINQNKLEKVEFT
jgi:hypothetical protein